VVDDDPGFAHGLAAGLRQHGFQARIATTLFEALDVLDDSGIAVEVIIIDLKLPQGNGVALGRMARLRRPDVKVLYVTGYDVTSVADVVAGAPLLAKPIQVEDVLHVIETVLRPPQGAPPPE
jgi:DNA-binding response OmpR family regulator